MNIVAMTGIISVDIGVTEVIVVRLVGVPTSSVPGRGIVGRNGLKFWR